MSKAESAETALDRLAIAAVIEAPEAWSRPEDIRRPYAFTVKAREPRRSKPKRPAPEPMGERPTPEQLAKGGYDRPTERGSLAVYTNRHINVLAKLYAHGSITKRMRDAGDAFEATYALVWGSASPGRDSTIRPIGGEVHETEAQAERIARGRARLHTILNRVGPRRYALLVSVCCYGEGLGGRDRGRMSRRYDDLRAGLTECAVAYGIA